MTNPRLEIVHVIIVSILLLKILKLRYVTSIRKCLVQMIVLLKQTVGRHERFLVLNKEERFLKTRCFNSKDLYQHSRGNILNTMPASANLHSLNPLIQDETKVQESQENTDDENCQNKC